jgi:two-component system OmpR family response regulator
VASAGNKINIFLVEDDKMFLLALKEDIEANFKKKNIKVHSFYTGEACMLKFVQVMPQIVILDYYLNLKDPQAADGVKVLDWIKKEGFDTHVIMLTSEDHIEVALDSFHHGASDYVVKTESAFRKINYSLSNIFKILEANRSLRKYKLIIFILCMCVASFTGGLIAIRVFAPWLLR